MRHIVRPNNATRLYRLANLQDFSIRWNKIHIHFEWDGASLHVFNRKGQGVAELSTCFTSPPTNRPRPSLELKLPQLRSFHSFDHLHYSWWEHGPVLIDGKHADSALHQWAELGRLILVMLAREATKEARCVSRESEWANRVKTSDQSDWNSVHMGATERRYHLAIDYLAETVKTVCLVHELNIITSHQSPLLGGYHASSHAANPRKGNE